MKKDISLPGAVINKSKIQKTKYIGEKSTEIFCAEKKYLPENDFFLYKPADRDFRILNITDIHFSDYDIRALMAFPAIRTVKKLVKAVRPDLITVTGDIVCGKSAAYSIERFTALMDSFKIPWAPVFGNHESETNCDKNYLADKMRGSRFCLFKKNDPEMGVGNYIVHIADAEDKSRIIHSFFMMDSHRGSVNDKQLDWYKWAEAGIKASNFQNSSGTVMLHIPLAEYEYAYNEAFDKANGCWRDGYFASGELHEKICCDRYPDGSPRSNGFFDVVKEGGYTKNIICGHEHMNNFSVVYNGIRLTYTLKVGKGSGYQPGFNGGTLITVNESGLKIKNIFIKSIL